MPASDSICPSGVRRHGLLVPPRSGQLIFEGEDYLLEFRFQISDSKKAMLLKDISYSRI